MYLDSEGFVRASYRVSRLPRDRTGVRQLALVTVCALHVYAQVFRRFYSRKTIEAIRAVIEPEFEEIFRADPQAIRTKLGAPVEVSRLHNYFARPQWVLFVLSARNPG